MPVERKREDLLEEIVTNLNNALSSLQSNNSNPKEESIRETIEYLRRGRDQAVSYSNSHGNPLIEPPKDHTEQKIRDINKTLQTILATEHEAISKIYAAIGNYLIGITPVEIDKARAKRLENNAYKKLIKAKPKLQEQLKQIEAEYHSLIDARHKAVTPKSPEEKILSQYQEIAAKDSYQGKLYALEILKKTGNNKQRSAQLLQKSVSSIEELARFAEKRSQVMEELSKEKYHNSIMNGDYDNHTSKHIGYGALSLRIKHDLSMNDILGIIKEYKINEEQKIRERETA
ncbi:hypothetical protein BVX95_00270 [archaeon D22]|nr:hypothetical protein BVX95_00270 [archaeon D22]